MKESIDSKKDFIQKRVADVPGRHINRHEGYEFYVKDLLSGENAELCGADVCEIPPGKSAYPYHYHAHNEEMFYIISGTGLLRTPGGERPVSAGDFLFFPGNEKGAHKLTNPSETEPLVYLDINVGGKLDVALYPDSGKIGVWGKDTDMVFNTCHQAGYYDGE